MAWREPQPAPSRDTATGRVLPGEIATSTGNTSRAGAKGGRSNCLGPGTSTGVGTGVSVGVGLGVEVGESLKTGRVVTASFGRASSTGGGVGVGGAAPSGPIWQAESGAAAHSIASA